MRIKCIFYVAALLVAFSAESVSADIVLAQIVVPPMQTLPEPAPPPSEQHCATQPTFNESLDRIIGESSLIVAARFTGDQMQMPQQKSESGLFSVRQLLVFDRTQIVKGAAPEKIYVAPTRAFQFQKGMQYLLFLSEVKLRHKTKSDLGLESDSVFLLRKYSHAQIK